MRLSEMMHAKFWRVSLHLGVVDSPVFGGAKKCRTHNLAVGGTGSMGRFSAFLLFFSVDDFLNSFLTS